MNRPWMPLYIADYRADTAHLNAAQHGAYLLLIMHYWQTGGLPTDDKQLARIVCMTPAEWRKAKPLVRPFFSDGWKHKRIEFELTEIARKSTAGRTAGLASAERRRNEKGNEPSTTGQRPSNDSATNCQPLHSERKKDAAGAALPGFEEAPTPEPDSLERQLFDRGKQVLGKDAGGLIAKLLKAKKRDVALARAAIEQASTKGNPREYIGAIISGGHASADGRRLTNDEQFYGPGRIAGVV